MAVKEILIWPNAILKKVSDEVVDFGPELADLINDLSDTMDTDNMAGLAAPQIGVNKRVFLMDIPPEHNEGNGTQGKEAFINPKIVSLSDDSFSWQEGCMSIPGLRGTVKRAKKVIMQYQDVSGNVITREAFDYLSGCFQHELDHLNGILWVDYQSSLKKNMVKKKMLSLQKALLKK